MSDANHKAFPFFVDGKRYETSKSSLTGGEIKAIAGVPANYQLFLEEDGDKADRPLSDGEGITMNERERHFFAVPPATFGTGR